MFSFSSLDTWRDRLSLVSFCSSYCVIFFSASDSSALTRTTMLFNPLLSSCDFCNCSFSACLSFSSSAIWFLRLSLKAICSFSALVFSRALDKSLFNWDTCVFNCLLSCRDFCNCSFRAFSSLESSVAASTSAFALSSLPLSSWFSFSIISTSWVILFNNCLKLSFFSFFVPQMP